MVDVKINPRQAQRDAIRDRLAKIHKPGTIKVHAANEDMRRILKHPAGNLAFRKQIDQSVEWPNDQFTQRRLAEGSVLREGESAPPTSKGGDDNKLSLRERAAARRPKPKEAAEAKKPEGPRGTPGPQ